MIKVQLLSGFFSVDIPTLAPAIGFYYFLFFSFSLSRVCSGTSSSDHNIILSRARAANRETRASNCFLCLCETQTRAYARESALLSFLIPHLKYLYPPLFPSPSFSFPLLPSLSFFRSFTHHTVSDTIYITSITSPCYLPPACSIASSHLLSLFFFFLLLPSTSASFSSSSSRNTSCVNLPPLSVTLSGSDLLERIIVPT